MRLVLFSIRKPVFILIFWAFIIFFGIQSLNHLPVTFLPPSRITDINVTTSFPGAEKERVLDDVTTPLENEIMSIKDTSEIVSQTRNGISEIYVKFKIGVPEVRAMTLLSSAINRAKIQFPSDVKDPISRPWSIASRPLKTMAITSNLPPPEFYNFVDKAVKPRFENIEGVSSVALVGQRQRQLTVSLNLEKMHERQISASEVMSRLKNLGENVYVSKGTTYGFTGEFSSIADLGSVAIRYLSNDRVIALRDIADIREELNDPDVYAYLNGVPCMILEVYIREDAEILAVQNAVDKEMQEVQDQYIKGKEKLSFFPLTNRDVNLGPALHDFTRNTWIAIAVSIFLIGFVFRDFRSIFISCTSIPASLCGAFLVMYLLGYSLNAYTIPALVVSVGLIIDDMIVIRENIFRHIEEGMSPYDATIKGMKEMGDPVIGTTFMVFSVCLPLIVLRGSETGQYLENFGVAMLLSMAFSLLEAFTLGPLLCAYLLKTHVEEETHASRFQKSLDKHYDRALKWVHSNAKMVLIFGVVVTFLGFVTPRFIRSEEMPSKPTGSMEMRMVALQGIPLKVIQKKARDFAQQIYKEYPDVRQIGMRVGNTNEMIFYIEMVEKKKRKIKPGELKADLEKKGKALLLKKEIIGYFVTADITAPRGGYVPQYTLRLSSYDSKLLRDYSEKMFDELKNYNGLTNLAMSSRAKAQETSVIFDFKKMNHVGAITPPVVKELDFLLNGDEPVSYRPPNRTDTLKSEVKVKTDLTSENADKLLKFGFVPNVNNTLIPFRAITGEISCDTSRQTSRDDGEEYVEITADLNQEALNERPISYTEKIMEDKIPLPEGITPSWIGKAKKLKDMGKLQGQLGYLALFFIYTVLILIYRSLTIPLVILISLPFSVAGSFFALFLTGNSVNLCSIIGIVLAIGIAAKNGIILVDYANQLIKQGEPPTKAMDTACKIRLRPILMTSVGVFLTSIPVIIPWDDYSRLQIGLGIAVIGGLVTAMTLSLFLLPIIFKYTHHLHEKVDNAILRRVTLPPDMK